MLLIYALHITPRIKYITKHLFESIIGVKINHTSKLEEFVAHNGPKCSYGKQALGTELFFQSTELLFEQGINEDIINIKNWDTIPCFYPVNNPNAAIPFDIFAASFYLITRYEEYLPQVKDKLGRFLPTESLAYKHNFLKTPIIDIWAMRLKTILIEKFPNIEFHPKSFSSEIICEVKEAFAFQKKGWLRTFGGYIKDISNLKFKRSFIRSKVLLGLRKDPYHTYNYLINKARKSNTNIHFFFGLGNYSSHEKSTNSNSQTYRKLIKSIADYCKVGIRISNDGLFDINFSKIEMKRFEQITHRSASRSFCQYAKIILPTTYRNLIEQEVKTDYSMGYKDYAGFRASTCTPFLFYDLDYEIQTPLKVVPFCVSKKSFAKINSSQKAISQISNIINNIKQVNGHAVIHIDNTMFDETEERSHFCKELYSYFLSLN